MLSNSTENLFGGINRIIAEKYAKLHLKESSVSDTDQKPKDGEIQLDETPCGKPLEESQNYSTFLKKEEFDSKLKELHLSPDKSDGHHIDVKDKEGKLQGWWNGNTGIGYIHKDCHAAMNESRAAFAPLHRDFEVHYNDENGDPVVTNQSRFSPAGIYRTFLKGGTHHEKGCSLVDIKHNGESVMPEAKSVVHGDHFLGEDVDNHKLLDQQDQATHTESGDFDEKESLKLAIQTAANRAKESNTGYHDEIIKAVKVLGLDPFRSATHAKLDDAVCSMTDGKYDCHTTYANDHINGALKEATILDKISESEKLNESREKGFMFMDKDLDVLRAFHRGESSKSENIKTDGKTLDGNWGVGKSIATRSDSGDVVFRRPACNSDEDCKRVYHSTIKKLKESVLTPELNSKVDEYVTKLKPKMTDFQDKYGENAESVLYGTATKLAKNDLGIKE